MAQGYDYIVAGGGSAGCVVAARLSEDPAIRVLLLEAGPRNLGFNVSFPLSMAYLSQTKNARNWAFLSEPEPHLDGRRIGCPRGRGLGGSSAINGMLYVRGNVGDYDQWRQFGLTGWGYDDVLPYFRKSEHHEGGHSEFHGGDGPVSITRCNLPNPIYAAVVEAGREAGYPVTPDFNGKQQEGFGWYDCNVRNGRRVSSAAGFLAPALRRPNLTILTGARIAGLRIHQGRACGVDYILEKTGERHTADVDGEIILSAGVFQSPQILQLAGVGDPERLASVGIRTVQELPGVGANLQDHLDVGVGFTCPKPVTMHSLSRGTKAVRMAFDYLMSRQGLASQPFMQVGAFLKSRAESDRPDMQLVFVPAAMAGEKMYNGDGYTFHMCQLDPQSRGRVDLQSDDPLADPRIAFNYLSTEHDRLALRHCVKVSRDIVGQPALSGFTGVELAPGVDVRSDAEIDAWVRANANTVYHPVGTCRMGRHDDPQAVCDERLRVRGIDGLRIADASVMPSIVSGNTHAPAMMIGEKAADMIKQDREARGSGVTARAA